MKTISTIGCLALLFLQASTTQAAQATGGLWDMGEISDDALGNGHQGGAVIQYLPQLVVTNNAVAVAALNDSLLLKSDGSLWITGDESVGDGTNVSSTNVFTEIVTNGVTAIAAGGDQNLFIKSDSSLWGFGEDNNGELGIAPYGTTEYSPVMIVPSGVVAVAAGVNHTLFLKNNGSLWAMGYNIDGQLGNSNYNASDVPVMVVPSGVTAIAAGYHFSLYIMNNGSLWGMGDNGAGELGATNTYPFYNTDVPVQIVPSGVTAVAAGDDYTLFLKNDGTLWGMGDGTVGQLGNGTNLEIPTPTKIAFSNVVAIAAGEETSLFIRSDGSLWGTGEEGQGQLGVSSGSIMSPGYVLQPLMIESQGVVAIASGEDATLFVQTPPQPPRPVIVKTSLTNANITLSATNGVTNGTYITLMSPILTQPLIQWTPVATNVLGATLNATRSFSVTLTNAFSPAIPEKFFILETP
jgi:alpha-tubulin suppressor-like RCC1 family protein